ncbi:MAG: hypothetical protein J2P17_22750 [Mycobacterium sp.]|nr:hypothetical protein [Mycobacterium sp.]
MSRANIAQMRWEQLQRQQREEQRRVEAAGPSAGLRHVASLYGVEASELQGSVPAPAGARVDMTGAPLPDLMPVRLVEGRPHEEWTRQEWRDAYSWQLGPRFRVGLKPPPGDASYYIPSPNDVSTYDPRSREWVPKSNTEARRVD